MTGTLRVRPVTGSEEDQTIIYLPLEAEPVSETRFPLPLASSVSSLLPVSTSHSRPLALTSAWSKDPPNHCDLPSAAAN